jgi:PhnB protein
METIKRQTITPSITVKNADAAIAFYEKVFGAKVDGHIMRGPNGEGIMHAELLFGDMKIFLNDEFPQMGAYSPAHYGGTPAILNLQVADVDKTYAAAVAAGAAGKMPPSDAFWGDRHAYVVDPFGHGWGLLAPRENLTQDQIKERSEQFWKQCGNK